LQSSNAQETKDKQSQAGNSGKGKQEELLKSLVGTWEGTCRTWFQPGKLADESKIKGKIEPVLGGLFLRHSYESTILGKPRSGEETIAFDTAARKFQVSWFDSFHMNYAIMFSEGEQTEKGFSVAGQYSVPDGKPWGWKTVFQMTDNDHLTITAYNITPDGQEAKAVETVYKRIKSK
jgi:hypothetical protein